MAQLLFVVLFVIVVVAVQVAIVRWVFRIDDIVGHLERIDESLSILVGQQRQAGPGKTGFLVARCTFCGERNDVPQVLAGKEIRCTSCKKTFLAGE